MKRFVIGAITGAVVCAVANYFWPFPTRISYKAAAMVTKIDNQFRWNAIVTECAANLKRYNAGDRSPWINGLDAPTEKDADMCRMLVAMENPYN